MKEVTDFVINSDNVVLEWNQDLTVGKDGSQWMTVDITYTNTVVGTLTDADFLTSQTADCASTCLMSEMEQLYMDGEFGWGEELEDDLGDDACNTAPDGFSFIQPESLCRMRELCGTGCEENECKWASSTG